MQWSAPANLDQVQRSTLALLRREVVTVSPPQFVDYLFRWQGLHPESRKGGADGLASVLARLEGLPLPAELWEQTVLPSRVPSYQPRWLDDWIAGGAGSWVARGDGSAGPGLVSFLSRDLLRQLPAPAVSDRPISDEASRVYELLRTRGAAFVADLAGELAMNPSAARKALWDLAREGLATNDRFDIVRKGGPDVYDPAAAATAVGRGPSMRGMRRRAAATPEGRWSALPWGRPEPEAVAVAQAWLLLNRYGVVARELALLDPTLAPWRILYEVLSRLELTGEVRRGYFAEGLSGAQFALPEAAQALQDVHLPSTAAAPVILLHSQDPSNLYGSGAPFDIALLDGGTRPLLRRPANWLALRAGRPILLIEQGGKRITALPSASRDDVAAAAICLPTLCGSSGPWARPKLTVEEWNGLPPTTSPIRELLESVGFVRDYQGMTLYAAWR
jgi:ATP-dependent Lhr-like helicase